MTNPGIHTAEVQANGLKFATLECGEGPLILCLHGFPDHAWSFRHQFEVLAAAGYRVVAPFMRGYAPTQSAPDGQYQSAVLAQDAVALIESLGYEEAVIFGHDWGAVAGYGAAILAPQRVRKLITSAVPHGPALLNAFLSDYAQQRRSWYMFFFQTPLAEPAVEFGGFTFLEHLWRDWSPGWEFPAEQMQSIKTTFSKPGVLSAALGYYRCTLNPAYQDPRLADLQGALAIAPVPVRTLIIHGAQDGCVGVNLLDGMEQFFPAGLRKHIIEGAGHFVHQEKPDIVNPALLGFLKED